MSEKMTLVTLKTTGHVLGALTRTGNPEGTLKLEDLVGADGLPIRDAATGKVVHEVQTGQLELETVDRLDEVLFRPSAYAVVAGALVLQALPSALTLQFSAGKLTITAPPPLKPGDKVWAQIEGSPGPRRVHEQAAILDGPGPASKVEISLVPGTYHLLVLVPGYQALLTTETFP
jgi:hypothetical protein